MNVALIRNGNVESVIVADLEFAATLGYEQALEVVAADRVAGGWQINDNFYPDMPVDQSSVNEDTLRQQAEGALVGLRVERDRNYGGLSAAAALALLVPAVKLVIRVQIGMLRLMLSKYDSTD